MAGTDTDPTNIVTGAPWFITSFTRERSTEILFILRYSVTEPGYLALDTKTQHVLLANRRIGDKEIICASIIRGRSLVPVIYDSWAQLFANTPYLTAAVVSPTGTVDDMRLVPIASLTS